MDDVLTFLSNGFVQITIIALFFLLGLLWQYIIYPMIPTRTLSSVLVEAFANRKQLYPFAIQPIAGYDAYLLATSISDSATDQAAILRVTLPFRTDVQLVGFRKDESMAGNIKRRLRSHGLEPVVLEGDFPSRFYLYATKNSQTESRVLVDPQLMAFIVDFCLSHTWEIYDNQLVFAMSGHSNRSDDPTTMVTDVEEFVRIIKPASVSG